MTIGALIAGLGDTPCGLNATLRVAVLSGNGKIFCAGADLVE